MHIIKVDPRALKENPGRMRQSKSSPQADAPMLATIKAVGIVQPPVVAPQTNGGNGYIIDAGHRCGPGGNRGPRGGRRQR